MRTVVFDLDGTLADTSGDLIAAANATFEGQGMGRPLDPIQDMAIAFAGGRAMLRAGYARLGVQADEDRITAGYPVLLDAYAQAIDVHTTLYPGAVAAVEALRSAGYATAICTNKPGDLARTLCQRLRIRDLFGSLVAADTLPVRKPDPAPYRLSVTQAGGDPARSVLIGDTITDRDTARAAGVPIILVAFGPEGADIARLSPDVLLDHYDDLGGHVARLLA